MKTVDGRIIPSSDRLLHDFLKGALGLRMSKMNLRCCGIWGAEKRLSVNNPHPLMTSRAYSQSTRPDS